MKLIRLGAWAFALALPGCYDFHTVGPEDPAPVKLPATVSVSVVYLQPASCVLPGTRCDGPVTFQASWMKPGTFINLQQTATHTWTATLLDVPVNFPNFPGDTPYRVYVVDPFRLDTPTSGVSAEGLTIGGERIVKFASPGGGSEQGLIYIDANGRGRTPQ